MAVNAEGFPKKRREGTVTKTKQLKLNFKKTPATIGSVSVSL